MLIELSEYTTLKLKKFSFSDFASNGTSQLLNIGVGSLKFSYDPAVEENKHTIGHHQDLIQLRG